jgi:hypothetical protein
VDFIYQNGSSHVGNVDGFLAGNGGITVQLVDLNPGTLFIRADNHSLIASGSLNIDVANCVASHTNDLYPDNFGATAQSESFMVVSDSMFLVAGNDGAAISTGTVDITARIRCRVVKLGSKDWMALAIQSTASES